VTEAPDGWTTTIQGGGFVVDRVLVGDVAGQEAGVFVERDAIEADDVVAGGGELAGEGGPDAARGPGHDRDGPGGLCHSPKVGPPQRLVRGFSVMVSPFRCALAQAPAMLDACETTRTRRRWPG